eukprot:scaffold7104_cov129-Isochrysis_galbana.AAC.2
MASPRPNAATARMISGASSPARTPAAGLKLPTVEREPVVPVSCSDEQRSGQGAKHAFGLPRCSKGRLGGGAAAALMRWVGIVAGFDVGGWRNAVGGWCNAIGIIVASGLDRLAKRVWPPALAAGATSGARGAAGALWEDASSVFTISTTAPAAAGNAGLAFATDGCRDTSSISSSRMPWLSPSATEIDMHVASESSATSGKQDKPLLTLPGASSP